MTGFSRVTEYRGAQRLSRQHLFSVDAPLALHDAVNGSATVDRAYLGTVAVCRVISTGHDVVVREHHCSSFLVPLNGSVSMDVQGTLRSAAPGQGLVVGRGVRRTRVASASAEDYRALVFLIPDGGFDASRELVEASHGICLDGAQSGDVRRVIDYACFLEQLIGQGTRLFESDNAARSAADLLVAFLAHAISAETDRLPEKRGSGAAAARHVRRAEEVIRARLADIASPAEVAEDLGVSTRTLEIAFRDVLGTSPAQFMATVRLHAARRALLSPHGPSTVTDACFEVGIHHHGRFSAAYRRMFGELPSETLRQRGRTIT